LHRIYFIADGGGRQEASADDGKGSALLERQCDDLAISLIPGLLRHRVNQTTAVLSPRWAHDCVVNIRKVAERATMHVVT